MGIIKDRIREALKTYLKDEDLQKLLLEIADIADHHIHYQWVRDHFDTELKIAFKEFILTKGIFNPSFRKGDINKK